MTMFETPAIEQSIATHRRHYGYVHFDRVTDKLIEEMAELAKELIKLRHAETPEESSKRRENIREEMTDVLLCMEFLGRNMNVSTEEMRLRVSGLASSLEQRLLHVERERRINGRLR